MWPRIRQYRADDLGRVVGLHQREGLVPTGPNGLTIDDVADLLGAPAAETLLAESDGEVVGMALGTVTGALGTIHQVIGDEELTGRLLEELEARMGAEGVRTFTVTVEAATTLHELLERRGYETTDGVVLHRDHDGQHAGDLTDLGARSIDPELWEQLQGMEQVKDVIERRIILPLAQPQLAARHGVTAPQSVVLFGPPGTGKTTFAKGVASRLAWPFLPVEVAQLVGGEGSDPSLLGDTFDRILEAPAAVAFFDEVEDLAADRQADRRVSSQVTNEFLRQLPRIRESFDHLLVCATNSVGSLDPAFLRPGRFDYIVPVGPPDEAARRAIWARYVRDITDEDVDLDELVTASERFTPADIEFGARKAAQLAFEAEHAGRTDHRATTEQFLAAIRDTRPTLTDDIIASFEQDVEEFARY